MSDSKDDLWGKEITSGPLPSPLSILREQAELLGEKTIYKLEGKVETTNEKVSL